MNTLMTIATCLDSDTNGSEKPLESILSMFSAIHGNFTEHFGKKSHVIEGPANSHHYCYFLIKGSIALHRRGDGIVMMSETAPFIFGLSNQLGMDNGMYLRVLEDATYLKIPSDIFQGIIAVNNLWEQLCRLLIYTTSRVYVHCARVQQMSSYDIIRSQLFELMNESDELRLSTAASNYIKNRTYLSRSGIMRILSELRSGGYIHMEGGILKSIIYLPQKY